MSHYRPCSVFYNFSCGLQAIHVCHHLGWKPFRVPKTTSLNNLLLQLLPSLCQCPVSCQLHFYGSFLTTVSRSFLTTVSAQANGPCHGYRHQDWLNPHCGLFQFKPFAPLHGLWHGVAFSVPAFCSPLWLVVWHGSKRSDHNFDLSYY